MTLAHRICLVAGASRGLGRGIARALGEAGATVIVTGRSSEAGPRTDHRPETFEDTAREVEAAGGRGHPYRCDHTQEREVDQLVSWALRRFGRLDCVVDAVWGGNEGYDGQHYPDGSAYGAPFWRRPAARLGQVFESGVYTQLLLARAVAPAMVQMRKGLIVTVGFETAESYLGDVVYDLAQAAMNRLSFAMAHELKPFGVTALGLSPGHVLTERVRDAGLAGETTETPLYAGRAVAALAVAPDVARSCRRGAARRRPCPPLRFYRPRRQPAGAFHQFRCEQSAVKSRFPGSECGLDKYRVIPDKRVAAPIRDPS